MTPPGWGPSLLADLDIASAKITDALWAALLQPGYGQFWVASALGRLGVGLQVLSRGDLPAASRVAAVTAPYRSFRDHGRSHQPLDYALLAAGLTDSTIAAMVAQELAPGSGYCTLDAADVPGVRAGLDHAEPIIRRHATVTVGRLIGPPNPDGLDPDEVAALRARVAHAAADDLDGFRR